MSNEAILDFVCDYLFDNGLYGIYVIFPENITELFAMERLMFLDFVKMSEGDE